jgi:hypothetical protein
MGRRLSKLQRFIVTEAARRPRLYYQDILFHFFKWPAIKPLEYRDYNAPNHSFTFGTPLAWEDGGVLCEWGDQHFSKAQIGAARYASVQVSTSRACKRLAKRGLVSWLDHWAPCVEITEAGRQWVFANTYSAVAECNVAEGSRNIHG